MAIIKAGPILCRPRPIFAVFIPSIAFEEKEKKAKNGIKANRALKAGIISPTTGPQQPKAPSFSLHFFPFFAEGVTRLLLENLLLGERLGEKA